jgi:hypothetical protein
MFSGGYALSYPQLLMGRQKVRPDLQCPRKMIDTDLPIGLNNIGEEDQLIGFFYTHC